MSRAKPRAGRPPPQRPAAGSEQPEAPSQAPSRPRPRLTGGSHTPTCCPHRTDENTEARCGLVTATAPSTVTLRVGGQPPAGMCPLCPSPASGPVLTPLTSRGSDGGPGCDTQGTDLGQGQRGARPPPWSPAETPAQRAPGSARCRRCSRDRKVALGGCQCPSRCHYY